MHPLSQTHLNAGDLVRVKSGGPVMTTERVDYDAPEPYARCLWFDARQQAQTVCIKIPALELAAEADARS